MENQNELKRLQRKITNKTKDCILKNELINKDDRVLIGLSGGKDSLILTEALASIRKKLPFPFQLSAIHIHIPQVGYKTDIQYLETFCGKLNIPFDVITKDVNFDNRKGKSPCFICSWHRRKTLFKYAKEHEYNKLALGHHMDDALETMLMNMIYHGSISSLPLKLTMFEGRMDIIRPMIYIPEIELIEYSRIACFEKEKENCPFEKNTSRNESKKWLKEIETWHNTARINLFNSMGKVYPEYLPKEKNN